VIAATSRSEARPGVRRFAALGDSFSSGIGEPGEVPWPEDVARRVGPTLELHNLAVAGATSRQVADDQLPLALEIHPGLVSVVCGANDVLFSPRPDTEACARTLDTVVGRLARLRPAPLVVMATYPEPGRFLGLRPRTRRRVSEGLAAVNAAIRIAAARHGAVCLEWAGRERGSGRQHYARDGLHPSPLSHRLAADAFTRALEIHL
jgi:lysophospholipase L1-like esterase